MTLQKKKSLEFAKALKIFEHVKQEYKELLDEGCITENQYREHLEDWAEQLDL